MNDTVIDPETIAALRGRYCALLPRGQAIALFAEMGLGRRDFEAVCRTDPTGFRLTIGSAVQFRYRRDFILKMIAADEE